MASFYVRPNFSIIVPVYNVDHYLRRCIDSIISQTYQDFEVIVVNDGSTDNSGAICDEYAQKDNRIHVFHKENGGVSAARNLGLEKAKGEYVLFVDSDDKVDKHYLSNYHRDSDFEIQGAVTINSTDGIRQGELRYKDEVVAIRCAENAILRGLNTAPWAKCFRKSIIDDNNIRFDEELSYGEDSIFIYKYMCYCSTIKYNSHMGYKYYIYEKGLGHKRHPIEKIVYMYSMQFKLYHEILRENDRQSLFFHNKVLFALSEFILWYNVSCCQLKRYPVIKRMIKEHLNILEKTLLYFPKIYLKYCSFYYKYFIQKL